MTCTPLPLRLGSLTFPPPSMSSPTTQDPETLEELSASYDQLRSEIGKVIVGQEDIIEMVVVCLMAQGHALLIGVPGLAKTLLVRTLASALDLDFSRIQFTPDLMPSDITGTEIIQETTQGNRHFEFAKGPIFANVVLADEINRTPPKTQAALLEDVLALLGRDVILNKIVKGLKLDVQEIRIVVNGARSGEAHTFAGAVGLAVRHGHRRRATLVGEALPYTEGAHRKPRHAQMARRYRVTNAIMLRLFQQDWRQTGRSPGGRRCCSSRESRPP